MRKKCILLVIFLIALFALSGCGKLKLDEEAETFKVYSELPEDITNAFINEEEAKNKKYLIVTYDELIKLPLSYWMLNNNMCIKIRTLLQYIGTDIGKQLIDNSLWTKLIANTISTKATKYRLCIIPDVRFRDETEMIKKLGGIIIKINRNTENNDNDKHISECIDNIKEDYIIDNNGTKFNLFYNIFNIINTVYREKREIIESRNND